MKGAAASPSPVTPRGPAALPRLGFLGVGWIGRSRMEAIAMDGRAEVALVADPSPECLGAALESAPGAAPAAGLDELIEAGLDGIVIATPSALHAEQAIAALESGAAVFCQKPLARTAAETRAVIDAARAADRLLGVDLSYRHARAMHVVRDLVASGGIGRVHAVDLVFHNAYGPDKAWFREPRLSGGGCAIDLGTHLVDLLLWTLGGPAVESVTASLRAEPGAVEDFCAAQLELEGGVVARLTCSWNLHAGRDCAIEATFYGTEGAATMRNAGGSFYDLRAEHWRGTSSETLVEPPDAWGGRAATAWAEALAHDRGYDPSVEDAAAVAAVLDRIYGRAA
jgi:predicted dehydrogenase